MTASVIFSTYNSEDWLEKTIIGFSAQTFKDFEMIIADDGSKEATKTLIDRLRNEIDIPIIHVWQEDNGFQKSQILNKSILASTSDYLIFTDGDCIPREDFVDVHGKNQWYGEQPSWTFPHEMTGFCDDERMFEILAAYYRAKGTITSGSFDKTTGAIRFNVKLEGPAYETTVEVCDVTAQPVTQ